MPYEAILYEIKNGIGKITINRPSRLNALNETVLQEIKKCVLDASLDINVKILIITGAGTSFSTGRDLESLGSELLNINIDGPIPYDSVRDVVDAVQSIPKVTIAMINGYCLTGALEIALACDLLIASENARFGDTHARWGIRPSAGMSQRLPLLVGVLKARELSFTSRIIDAAEAGKIGLVNFVVPTDQLESKTLEIAQEIMKNSPDSIATYKYLINSFMNNAIQQGVYQEVHGIFHISDTMERLNKFKKNSVASK